jgi:hypothetical protein
VDTTTVTIPDAATMPLWLQILIGVIGLVLSRYLIPWLKAHAAAATVSANADAIDARGRLAERLKAYLWGQAAAIAEKQFPQLAADIAAGKFKDPASIKAELRSWGEELKAAAVTYFRNQGIDLVATYGEQALDDLIERAANAASPFPGKDTAVALLEKDVAPLLIAKGVEWMKSWTLARLQVPAVDAVKPAAGAGPSYGAVQVP